MNKLYAVAVGLLITLTLSACASGAGSSGTAGGQGGPPPRDINTTLTIWSYLEPKDFPYITEWINRFNKTYPNVKVDWVWMEQARLTSKLLGSAISGDAPDGVFFNPAAAAKLSKAGLLRDLTPYWKGYKHKDKFPESIVWRYQGQVLSAQPYVSISAMWYNKDILRQLGVMPLEDPPMNVQKFESVLAKATKKGYTGLTMACEPSEKGEFSAFPWFLGQGVNYGNFKQEPTARVYSMFSEWSKKGYIPKDCVGWTGAIAFQKFLSGDVAFTYNGNWNLSLAKQKADFDYGVMPMPAGPAGSHSIPGGEGIGITQQTSHPDLMWEFWKIALSRQGQLTALKSNGSIPTRSDLADASYIQQRPILQTYTKVAAHAGQRPSSPKIYKAMQTLGRLFNAVVGDAMEPSTAARKLRQKTSYIQCTKVCD